MPHLSFEYYRFCEKSLRLTRHGEPIALRPKTALLLRHFLRNPGQMQSKSAIFLAVWESEHIQDHSLFQSISELRRLPGAREWIRTQPNCGYVWQAPVSRSRFENKRLALAAAMVFVFVGGALTLESQNRTPVAFGAVPALAAVTKGAAAMEQGDLEEASRHLEFALLENPDAHDARLLLAEVWYQRANWQAALAQAQMLRKAIGVSDYHRRAARDLASRVFQAEGNLSQALEFAELALDGEGAYCTAEHYQQRVASLRSALGNTDARDVLLESHEASTCSESASSGRPNRASSAQEASDDSACLPYPGAGVGHIAGILKREGVMV